MTFESLFNIDDEVTLNGSMPAVIVAVRFTKAKVFYDVLDIYHGCVEKNVPSEMVTGSKDLTKYVPVVPPVTEQEAKQAYDYLESNTPVVDVVQTEEEYNEADLVSFGNYMVSEERKLMFDDGDWGGLTKAERLSQVHHADIENWKEKRKGGGK